MSDPYRKDSWKNPEKKKSPYLKFHGRGPSSTVGRGPEPGWPKLRGACEKNSSSGWRRVTGEC